MAVTCVNVRNRTDSDTAGADDGRHATPGLHDRVAAAGRGADATGILDRHLVQEQAVTGQPLVSGNRVRLLEDGPETYRAMFAAIAAATDHINMETYIVEDDAVGRRFADALIAKQQQDVQVSLVYDSVGTLGTPDGFFQRLRDSGIRTLQFNPVNPATAKAGWELNQRDHRKLLIVDGRTVFLGGINISSVYSGGSARRRHARRASGPHGLRARLLRRSFLLRPVVAGRRGHLRATGRADACEDRRDRRRVVDGRLNQPRLAQLPCTTRRSARWCSAPISATACASPLSPTSHCPTR
jgi:hypothetical protein